MYVFSGVIKGAWEIPVAMFEATKSLAYWDSPEQAAGWVARTWTCQVAMGLGRLGPWSSIFWNPRKSWVYSIWIPCFLDLWWFVALLSCVFAIVVFFLDWWPSNNASPVKKSSMSSRHFFRNPNDLKRWFQTEHVQSIGIIQGYDKTTNQIPSGNLT